MQIIERSSLGVRTAIWTLASKTVAPFVTLFPMIHVGEPRFYLEVKNRLENYDFILFEGLNSKVTEQVTRSYSLFPDPKKNGLMVQPDLNPEHFPGKLIHADLDGESFDEAWDKLPLKLRLLILISSPIYGIYAKFFKSGDAFFESTGLDLLESREEIFYNEDMLQLDALILQRRDQHLIACLDRLLETQKDRHVKIAIVFGAAHMRAVLKHLVLKLDFKVQDSEWMTIAG